MREDGPVDFNALMESLTGGVTTEEAALLRRLASEVHEGCIVEVGSFRGKSAVALATGVREQERAQRPSIYCIEPHRPFTGFYGGEFGPEDRGAFYEVMCRTGMFHDVALVNLSSEEVTPAWKEPVALIFIDGDHSYTSVKKDFECWESLVMTGGLVAFDDATDPACGPHRLIGEILDTGRYLFNGSRRKNCCSQEDSRGDYLARAHADLRSALSSRMPRHRSLRGAAAIRQSGLSLTKLGARGCLCRFGEQPVADMALLAAGLVSR